LDEALAAELRDKLDNGLISQKSFNDMNRTVEENQSGYRPIPEEGTPPPRKQDNWCTNSLMEAIRKQ
jgi:hypothetical protein